MVRLVLAVFIALGLHILLFRMIVPEKNISETKREGTGQVTISIVRASLPVEDQLEKPVKEPEQAEQSDQNSESLPEEFEQMHQERKVQPERTEAVKEHDAPESILPVVPVAMKQSTPVGEDKAVPAISTKDLSKQERFYEADSLTEKELLKGPEPIQYLNRPPSYPPLARKRGWQGTVVLEVYIQSNGMVMDIRVKQSSSYALLDEKAMEAVKKWHFQPGSRAGKPVDMKVLVPVHFVLQER